MKVRIALTWGACKDMFWEDLGHDVLFLDQSGCYTGTHRIITLIYIM